jgi:UDP-glucuronate 4-epimerase
MNALVTGGAGFIGSHVVERLLDRGDTVTVIDDFNEFYNPSIKRNNVRGFANKVKLVEADICSDLRPEFSAQRFDTIIHLAARAGVRPSLAQPQLYTRVNVVGTQNLLELAREFGVRKFVFASSSSVYGVNQKVPFNEEDPIFKPISPYAATKLAGEALCHVWPGRCLPAFLHCLWPATATGPRHSQIHRSHPCGQTD